MEYALMPFRRFFELKGRSRRKEYWHFTLLITLVSVVIAIVESATGLVETPGDTSWLSGGFSAVTFIPSLTVLVRRLHDTGRSGWWLFGFLPPIILFAVALTGALEGLSSEYGFLSVGIAGAVAVTSVAGVVIALFVFCVLDGTRGPNRYGEDPKDSTRDLGEVFD